MSWKNWKKNYHSNRIGNNWGREGVCQWFTFGEDWKNFHRGTMKFWQRPKHKAEPTLADISFWRKFRSIAGVDTPISELSYFDAVEIGKEYGRIERKLLLSAGGYSLGRKKYYKKVYNKKRRRIGKAYCKLAEIGLVDEGDSLDQGKDRRFAWAID